VKRVTTGLVGLGLAASLGFAYTAPSNAASSPPDSKPDRVDKTLDELPNPLETKRRALRSEAVANVVSGKSKPIEKDGISVVKVGKSLSPQAAAVQANKKATKQQKQAASGKTHDQYVELQQERSDKIFVILAEFGNQRHPDFPDVDSDPSVEGPRTFEGPLHNAIPEPDRTKDNSTVWQPDYNREHYQDLYFGKGKGAQSVKTYYEKQSSGRYTVDGTVSDWVKVPYNEARYGRDDSSRTVWNLIQDAVASWVKDQKAAGKTNAEIKKALTSYDKYDRYDYDGDGDFNEPDGYVDHFQIVHAGGDEADGDPQQGEDAIWSHRWYAYYTDQGLTGPDFNKLGGTQVGNTGVWIGDYTIQPENGGLSVFVHEYGHDLGLPDDYDTSGGGDNNSEYWTLMAQSRLNGKNEPLGSRPGDLGAWNKLQLGWLDYEAIATTEKRTLELGPQEYNTDKAQGAVVVLPDKNITVDNGAPASGQKQFWSTKGDNLVSSMTTDLDLTGATDAKLTAKVRYSIEEGYDYGYVQVSTDGGSTWTSLDGTIDGQPMAKDASNQSTFSGEHPNWGNLEVPLTSVAGQDVKFRAIYKTDGGVAEQGLFLDDIKVTKDGATVLEDGAEDGGEAWTFDTFTIVGATSQKAYDNFYIAGHRSYVSYDRYLKTGPYNFGFMNTKPDWVEHYKYGHGLLVSYWDTSQADNNTNVHPGVGRNMIIDANPRPITNIVTGAPWRARIQMYDAPFSKHTADSMTLHTNGKPSYIRGQAAQPLFDDTKQYWFAELPNHGVKLPAVGVKIRVLTEDGTAMKVRFN
jgi:immune inhibitor A